MNRTPQQGMVRNLDIGINEKQVTTVSTFRPVVSAHGWKSASYNGDD
jgi:hypothetical protein